MPFLARTGGCFSCLPPPFQTRWRGQDGWRETAWDLPSSHCPGDRLVLWLGGEGGGSNGEAATRTGIHPQGCAWHERGFVAVPHCASELLALPSSLNRELDVPKRINSLILFVSLVSKGGCRGGGRKAEAEVSAEPLSDSEESFPLVS